jgi:hypothetical protein
MVCRPRKLRLRFSAPMNIRITIRGLLAAPGRRIGAAYRWAISFFDLFSIGTAAGTAYCAENRHHGSERSGSFPVFSDRTMRPRGRVFGTTSFPAQKPTNLGNQEWLLPSLPMRHLRTPSIYSTRGSKMLSLCVPLSAFLPGNRVAGNKRRSGLRLSLRLPTHHALDQSQSRVLFEGTVRRWC